MGGEELLPTWQQYGDSYTCQRVSQVLNVNQYYRDNLKLGTLTLCPPATN